MKNTQTNHPARALAAASSLAALLLLAPGSVTAQSATADALGLTRSSELVISEKSQVLELGNGQTIEGDILVSGQGCNIVIHPGLQTIKGNLQINGSDDHLIFEFDEEKNNGHLKVEGEIRLGPDNSPVLNLDLSKVNLAKGEVFTIISAGSISGEFLGMGHGDTLALGDYCLQIHYNPDSITLMVVDAPQRPLVRVTPVMDIADLIEPTSTGPNPW